MKVLELFAGTCSVSNAFKARGHEVLTVDNDEELEGIDIYKDVMDLTPDEVVNRIGGGIDVIWASPDCTTYSVAAISHHRTKDAEGRMIPISDYAKYCDAVNVYMHNLIMMLNPKVWFIENPRGAMRKMDFMAGLKRYTVTYCQYGEERMKPTDIFTNHPNPRFKPPCRNGDPCHVPAPRGAVTGTQGIKGAKDRGRIPLELCNHIVDICEELISD